MTTGTSGPLSQTLMSQMGEGASGDAAIAKAMGTETYEPPEIEDGADGYVRLPLGLKDHPDFGTIETAEVRELTGRDEERIARAIGSDNPWRIGTVMLECGVTRLGDEVPTREMINALVVGDRDFLLLQIRIMTYGTEVTYDLRCPFCQREQSVDIDLKEDVPLKESDGNPLRVDLKKGAATVYLPTGAEDEMMLLEQTKNGLTGAETDTLLLAECITDVTDGVWLGVESARNMRVADRATVLKALSDNQPGPDFSKMMVSCVSCDGEYRLPISLPEIFR